MNKNANLHLDNYISEQSLAEKMIPAVGDLYREHGVIITVFGRKLMGAGLLLSMIRVGQVSRVSALFYQAIFLGKIQ